MLCISMICITLVATHQRAIAAAAEAARA